MGGWGGGEGRDAIGLLLFISDYSAGANIATRSLRS